VPPRLPEPSVDGPPAAEVVGVVGSVVGSVVGVVAPVTVTVRSRRVEARRRLRAAARGHSNPEIAEALFISLGTVKTHLSSLQGKIGARNRVELAAFAWQSGRMRS